MVNLNSQIINAMSSVAATSISTTTINNIITTTQNSINALSINPSALTVTQIQ